MNTTPDTRLDQWSHEIARAASTEYNAVTTEAKSIIDRHASTNPIAVKESRAIICDEITKYVLSLLDPNANPYNLNPELKVIYQNLTVKSKELLLKITNNTDLDQFNAITWVIRAIKEAAVAE